MKYIAVGAMKVSILVFVELALGRHDAPGGHHGHSCFNPCFCGTRSRTKATGLEAVYLF